MRKYNNRLHLRFFNIQIDAFLSTHLLVAKTMIVLYPIPRLNINFHWCWLLPTTVQMSINVRITENTSKLLSSWLVYVSLLFISYIRLHRKMPCSASRLYTPCTHCVA